MEPPCKALKCRLVGRESFQVDKHPRARAVVCPNSMGTEAPALGTLWDWALLLSSAAHLYPLCYVIHWWPCFPELSEPRQQVMDPMEGAWQCPVGEPAQTYLDLQLVFGVRGGVREWGCGEGAICWALNLGVWP